MLQIDEIKTDSNGITDIDQNNDISNNILPIVVAKEEELLIDERVERWYNRAKDNMSGFQ